MTTVANLNITGDLGFTMQSIDSSDNSDTVVDYSIATISSEINIYVDLNAGLIGTGKFIDWSGNPVDPDLNGVAELSNSALQEFILESLSAHFTETLNYSDTAQTSNGSFFTFTKGDLSASQSIITSGAKIDNTSNTFVDGTSISEDWTFSKSAVYPFNLLAPKEININTDFDLKITPTLTVDLPTVTKQQIKDLFDFCDQETPFKDNDGIAVELTINMPEPINSFYEVDLFVNISDGGLLDMSADGDDNVDQGVEQVDLIKDVLDVEPLRANYTFQLIQTTFKGDDDRTVTKSDQQTLIVGLVHQSS